MARIRQDPRAFSISWWDPVYPFVNLEVEWEKSLNIWLEYLLPQTEEELSRKVEITGFDGGRWAATSKDIP